MRSPIASWTSTLTKLGFTRNQWKNRMKGVSSRPLRVEGLEDRRMLAVGEFLRLDGIPNSVDQVVTDYVAASAIATVNGQEYSDGDTGGMLVGSELIATHGVPATANIGFADSVGTANEIAQQITDIGNTIPAPTVSLAGIQTAGAQWDVPLYNPETDVGPWAAGEGDSRSSLYNTFQFQAPSGQENEQFLLRGFIHAAALGGAAATENLVSAYDAYTKMNVWLGGRGDTLLASAKIVGSGYHNGYELTSDWDIDTSVRYLDGSGLAIHQDSIGGGQVLIPFFAIVGDGAVITFDAGLDPWESLNDGPGLAGAADVTPKQINTGPSASGSAAVLEVLGGWCWADPLPATLPDDPEPVIGGGGGGGGGGGQGLGIGDPNGDGISNEGDLQELIDWGQTIVDFASQSADGRAPLIVSTEDDVANGDYSIDDLSLREAIALAADSSHPGEDVIVFAPWVNEIALNGTQLVVNSDVRIAGPGADKLVISGNGNSRVFSISNDTSTQLDVTISGLTITGGYAATGAGVHNNGENVTLADMHVVENIATTQGGGVWQNSGSSLQLYRSSVSDNQAGSNVGGLYSSSGTVSVVDSTIARNESPNVGGFYLSNSEAEFVNSTISTNKSYNGWGSGIYVTSSIPKTTTLTNTTVAFNEITSASATGGGIRSAGAGVNVEVYNSIIADNTKAGARADVYGAFNSVSAYNLIGAIDNSTGLNSATSYTGTAASPQASGLAPLGNYGGPTQTHALFAGSDAIDHGSDAFALNLAANPVIPLEVDQRGQQRKVGTVDIGAYESGNDYNLLVTIPVDESNSGYEADDMSLREALELLEDLAGTATITFDKSLYANGPATLQLSQTLGELSVSSNYVNIVGPGRDLLTVDANADSTHQYRQFNVSGSQVLISNLTLTGGNTSSPGAAILGPSGGTLTLDSVRVTGHESTSTGGIIEQAEGSLLIIDSEIDNNMAPSGSAVRLGGLGGGLVDIRNSSIHSNNALGVNAYGSVDLINSTVSTNSKGGVSILQDEYQHANVINSTIAYNGASSTNVSGLHIATDTSYQVSVWNTIIAENQANGVDKDVNGNFSAYRGHNLIGTTSGSAGLTGDADSFYGVDPMLAPLDDYGGGTRTHKLLAGSDAINAGDNDIVDFYDLEFDQRGYDRITDGDLDDFDTVDIGAFELAFSEY
jgi:hypothetical protein